jgi:hypothetical protein
MILALAACAGTNSATSPNLQPMTANQAPQDAAKNSLYAIGIALQATPQVLTALYNSGKLSKADYNSAVPVFNQALASFQLAVNALQAAVKAGQDPNQSTAYLTALNSFVVDKANIDNLLTAFQTKGVK